MSGDFVALLLFFFFFLLKSIHEIFLKSVLFSAAFNQKMLLSPVCVCNDIMADNTKKRIHDMEKRRDSGDCST